MKKKFHFMKASGKRTVLLVAVSLLLVVVLAVSATISWIEDVSQVKFNSTDDAQKTPLHVGSKVLKSDMLMEQVQDQNTAAINLSDYFYKSGDMHLSPCYADGDNFYFPIEGSDANGGTLAFRNGTKDDANVNYLSVTFRVKSDAANTAYWFEKTDSSTPYVSFKNGNDNAAGLEQFIRFSITIDGATNVYALDDNGSSPYLKSYKTVENGSASTKTGRSVEEYSYYQEVFKNDNTSNGDVNGTKPNQGPSGGNLNGNTLFTVNKFENNTGVKTVTLKLWLEFGGYTGDYAVTGIDLASVNMKIVSSWAKTRRIFVKDETVDEWDTGLNAYRGTNWLTGDSATLHWSLRDRSKHWAKNGNVGDIKLQYFDIPAVYNNTACTLYRCTGDADDEHPGGWNTGNEHSDDIKYWNKYETTFPDTFHSETFSVYTLKFGTWEPVARHVEIINSCQFNDSPYEGEDQFTEPYAYMWDNSSVYGNNQKVVENASWPGVTMTKLNQNKDGLYIYAFYYNAIFDRIIFNDDYSDSSAAYQTADINLDQAKTNPQYYVGKVYDMATMKWYNSSSDLPEYSKYSVYGNFYKGDGGARYTVSRMVKIPNSNIVYCRIYLLYDNNGAQYKFKVFKHDGAKTDWKWYGYGQSDGVTWEFNDGTQSQAPEIYEGQNNLSLVATNTNTSEYQNSHPGVYGFYFDTQNNTLQVRKETIAGPASLPTSLPAS